MHRCQVPINVSLLQAYSHFLIFICIFPLNVIAIWLHTSVNSTLHPSTYLLIHSCKNGEIAKSLSFLFFLQTRIINIWLDRVIFLQLNNLC